MEKKEHTSRGDREGFAGFRVAGAVFSHLRHGASIEGSADLTFVLFASLSLEKPGPASPYNRGQCWFLISIFSFPENSSRRSRCQTAALPACSISVAQPANLRTGSSGISRRFSGQMTCWW